MPKVRNKLAKFTDGELEAELERRKENNKLPIPINFPSWNLLRDYTHIKLQRLVNGELTLEEFEEFVYQTTLETIYGDAFWSWFNRQKYHD